MEPRTRRALPPAPDRSASERYRRLIHLLNQRYREEFDRAERLRDQLADIKASRAWRFACGLKRLWSALAVRLPRLHFRKSEQRQALAVRPWPLRPPLAGRRPPVRDRISIVIPFKDKLELLHDCLMSIQCGTHRKYEIILVDNGGNEPRTHEFLDRLEGKPGWQVITWPGAFNFSRLCNEGARRARGDYLLFLNNDTEVLSPDWLEQLLRVAEHPLAGVVGATLYYPNLTIQHAGIFRENGCTWSHVYRGKPADYPGQLGELKFVREVPAVTGACLLVRRDVFNELGGFDERLPVTFNDIDLCRRVRRHGLRVFITPHAQLLHYESLSRGYQVEPVTTGQ